MSASRKELLALLEQMQIPVSKAFLASVDSITSKAQIKLLTSLVEAAIGLGDLSAALRAAGMRPGSWSQLIETVRGVYLEGGIFTMAADVPKRFGAEFNMHNERAETWLRLYSSELITFISAEQIQTIQIILQAGMRAGRNPRSIALDIVGRVSRQTGRRAGGIIGLNVPQTNAVVNARLDLENLNANYFTRVRRDKRFDSVVRKAIANDTALARATVNKLVGRYSDSLLKLRGDTIGRTEALKSLNASADEALRQIIDEGYAPTEAVKRIWRHSYSPGERPGHLQMSGQPRDVGESFVNPLTRVALLHPGVGPASEVINCRCMVEHKIDFVKVELAGI